MIERATNQWYDNAIPTECKLIVLHPNFANHHLLVNSAMYQKGRTPIFLELQAPSSNLNDVWAEMGQSFKDQIDQTLPKLDRNASPEDAAQLTFKTLQAVGNFTLFIDAFDLAQDDVVAWIGALAKKVPSNSQVILDTRKAPMQLLANQALKEQIRFFPVDGERMLLDYPQQPADRVLLEVYGLGPGQALINGERIDHWDGLLPRSLFFYFVDRGMITRDEIFQTFWPTLSIREATNVFHVTKRKISEILGFDLTVYWSGFYRISSDIDLHYDVVKFAENVQNSVVAADDDAITMLERAIYLYRGFFLNSLDMEWANSRRAELRLTYTDALSTLGRLRQQRGEMQEALGLYLRAAATQPHREDLARGIMSLYAELGQQDRALAVYKHLVEELKHTFGVAPDPQTTELMDIIRQR